ncbi:hypothetical protein GCM10020219_004930 [Nonomuraea dietziae]
MGFEAGRIGIEAQIENARGLVNADAIAGSSPRLRDAGVRPRRLHGLDQHAHSRGGEQPPGYTEGDAYH